MLYRTVFLFGYLIAASNSFVGAVESIDFNRDVRPILSDKCFQCHGPDVETRSADLRLDVAEDAMQVIQPHDAGASDLIARITSDDPDLRMPPPGGPKQLSDDEIGTLTQWVNQGAVFEGHWAFQPILKPSVPAVKQTRWPANPIDHFVLHRLEQGSLSPSPQADKRTLLRRVTLDLTGLPPTPEEYKTFIANPDWSGTIDRLMNSPRYGEHMAWRWLDAARYADSDGYESDPLRNMWPWRDWVVEAFNRHMPFDQFIIEQLAGDQLENPTLRQILATGFNRNHRLNNEGGVDPAEWLVEYVCDRAETTATVFMGLTWQCARCHDHKYDPITMKDYYQLFDFFHQLPEIGNGRGSSNAPPMIEVSALPHLDAFAKLDEELAPLVAKLDEIRSSGQFKQAFDQWLAELREKKDTHPKLPPNLQAKPVAKWDKKLKSQARVYYLEQLFEPAAEVLAQMRPLEKRKAKLRSTGAKVMVMQDRPEPRESFILARGVFNQPTDLVQANSPHFLPPMDRELPRNRLGLAKWLVHPEHPLTSRVAVNRTWERFFGVGLVKTSEDFGSQGEPPSHPELLDFLARRLIESGWDLQALQKLILTSQTYQQSSKVTERLRQRDPDNRLIARGPRYRLPAAVIRDSALASSGLLVQEIGGPPVKPYQPEGLWKEIIKGRVVYRRDTGERLYRRSLYTLWRRAVKPPLMSLLDANGRDTCAVNTKRTNTPLQALLLLNDETFVELARGLATQMLLPSQLSDEQRLDLGMQLTLGRNATRTERTILLRELQFQRDYFQTNPQAVEDFLKIGDAKPDPTIEPHQLAAMTSVARVLMNLDETVSKE